MVIIYKKDTKEISRTEDNTMVPALPYGTLEQKKEALTAEGLDFVSLPYEMGSYIHNFNLCFDDKGQFTGLQPK